MFDVEENRCISDILLVRHQDSTDDKDAMDVDGASDTTPVGKNGHPACEIFGYDCECEPKDCAPDEYRKPDFTDQTWIKN